MSGIYVIAEAGVNHNGSLETARRLVDAAASVGADAVKFQAFHSRDLATSDAATAGYQEASTGETSQEAMLSRLELSDADLAALKDHCVQAGIDFLCSAFDLGSIEILAALGMSCWKVPSGEITDLPYLRSIARHATAGGQRVLLSTGMADNGEVAAALNVLYAEGVSSEQVVVLHCSTEYPAPVEDTNLLAMVSMRRDFGVEVGYSDHTQGIAIASAAAALGAVVLEKHLTLDRAQAGPDHAASLEPSEFADMVGAVRAISLALGDGVKRPAPGELANRAVARKSVVAKRDIAAGDVLDETNLAAKRPASGLSPMLWDEIVGSRATRDYAADEMIEL